MFHHRLHSLIFTGNLSTQMRCLITTSKAMGGFKWRTERGEPGNPTARGVLTDGPDYSFMDGRLTPLGSNQKKRVLRQKEVCEQIVDLSAEIDFALDRHKQLKLQEETERRKRLERKLKPKGIALLKSK